MIFLWCRSSNSSRRTDLQQRSPPWVSKMCSLEVLVRPTQNPRCQSLSIAITMFLRKRSRHRLSRGNQFTAVGYTLQLLECGLSTPTSLVPGKDPSTVTDQPRIEHVTFNFFCDTRLPQKPCSLCTWQPRSDSCVQPLHCSVKIFLV